ncbi:MAG: ACP S-malonyltransferase [Kiritimatiellae bacterium]|nr:ACP S-malonyltransferase [Kiritimatiellia bacterium]
MSKSALIFAGQGAQFVGMGRDLADRYSECRALFETANAVLGYDLAAICFEGPEEELKKTNHCQPAIFVTSCACYAALRAECPEFGFEAAAGLSLGEWTALWATRALDFEDAVRILEARGRFMQEACDATEGGMLVVIGLDQQVLGEICAKAGVQIANLNSPAQTVLSGPKSGIEKAEGLAREAGAKKTVVLRVAGAYHSALMSAAATRLEQTLAGAVIRPPAAPVVANVTGRPHGAPDDIRADMVRQVTSTVQWVSGVRWCREQQIGTFVECGPGKVLSGLIKQIDKEATVYNIQDLSSLQRTAAALRGGNQSGTT